MKGSCVLSGSAAETDIAKARNTKRKGSMGGGRERLGIQLIANKAGRAGCG